MISAIRGIPGFSGRVVVAGLVFGLVLSGLLAGRLLPSGPLALVQSTIDLVRSAGIVGSLLFAALQVLVAVSGAVPASLMGMAAGAVYGLVPGFVLAAFGSLLGALLAFGLSRSLFRGAIERLVSRYGSLQNLDCAVARDGWKLVFLLRLSPIMPFSATSYLLGLSSVSLVNYLIGTLASLPALFGYVFIGTLTDAGVAAWADGTDPLRWALLGLGGIATLLLTVHLGRLLAQRPLALRLVQEPGGGCAR
ncbi:MAG TPA: VTT domain-containing protein [Stellaceae bacterium]|nr:VTT domain-containing protein [Stellaceae bacterium]